jgi:acyl-CoA oxidase
MAHQKVTPEGKYVKSEKRLKNDKLHYATMMFTRGFMVKGSGGFLARACTIAIRYSCVRRQGFAQQKKAKSYKSEERQIIDHQVQRYRLFRQLALAYAIKFTGKWMLSSFEDLSGGDKSGGEFANLDALPFLAATSAGLKALCTIIAWQGIEDLRKCCGGNGYLLNSGLAGLAADYAWQSTAEGDWVILMLTTAGFLIKTVDEARSGKPISGPVDYLIPLKDKGFQLSQVTPPNARGLEDFLNLDYLISLFKYAALAGVLNADISLKSRTANKADYPTEEDAWNGTGIELLSAVRAHCYYFLMFQFAHAVKQVTDPAIRSVLTRLAALFACSNMTDEPHWIGLIDAAQVKTVKSAIVTLLNQLRPDAVALVDAFGMYFGYERDCIGDPGCCSPHLTWIYNTISILF